MSETAKSVAVATVVIARFLAMKHPEFEAFATASLSQAKQAGLSDDDMSLLKTIAVSIRAKDRPNLL